MKKMSYKNMNLKIISLRKDFFYKYLKFKIKN